MPRQSGVLKAWKDDRGFGFISPRDGSNDLFVHIHAFGNIPRKPRVGDTLYYQSIKDSEGRHRAVDVQIDGVVRRPDISQQAPQKTTQRTMQKSRQIRPLSATGLLIVCVILGFIAYRSLSDNVPASGSLNIQMTDNGNYLIRQAYQNQQSNLQVTGSGVVVKMLPDDLEGSRHQKFILKLPSGLTLLVAHNIDLAPRLSGLKTGAGVNFSREYKWNRKGGVVHWTHHDPSGRHTDGWLEYNGQKYQ